MSLRAGLWPWQVGVLLWRLAVWLGRRAGWCLDVYDGGRSGRPLVLYGGRKTGRWSLASIVLKVWFHSECMHRGCALPGQEHAYNLQQSITLAGIGTDALTDRPLLSGSLRSWNTTLVLR